MVSHRRLCGIPGLGGSVQNLSASPARTRRASVSPVGLNLLQVSAGIDLLGASPVSPACCDCARSVRSRRDRSAPFWLLVSIQYVLHQGRVPR